MIASSTAAAIAEAVMGPMPDSGELAARIVGAMPSEDLCLGPLDFAGQCAKLCADGVQRRSSIGWRSLLRLARYVHQGDDTNHPFTSDDAVFRKMSPKTR